MDIKRISPFLSVSPQIYPVHIKRIADEGFKTIINNRPDKEVDDQPLAAELTAEAARLGLVMIDHPVIPGKMTENDVARFDNDLKTAEGPILAFCRTGTRSTILWAMNEVRHKDVDVILKIAASIGIDLSKQRSQLERQRTTKTDY